ncbi:MAG: ATPase, partial [Thermoleophilia bacterium]|nr:ATPase [Thermoleophilia bacterium]
MTPDAIPDLLAELDALVGLAPVKAGVERLVAIHQLNSVRVTAGKPIIAHDLDLMFTGDPGTGEDQVAALIGRLYAALGLLPAGQVVEVRRGDLVGATAEETQARVQAAVTAASGGVLFVDDAEQLIPLVPEDQGIVALAALAAAVDVRPVLFACIVSGPTDAIDAIAVHYPAFVYAHAAA